jgi:hypothetical protein
MNEPAPNPGFTARMQAAVGCSRYAATGRQQFAAKDFYLFIF